MEWASMSSGAVQLKVRATSNVSGEWQIASVIAYPDEISLDDNTHWLDQKARFANNNTLLETAEA